MAGVPARCDEGVPERQLSLEQEEENLVPFGYYPLHQGVVPQGDVVWQVTPQLIDGKWTRQYESRAYNDQEIADMLATARTEKLTAIDSLLYATYARGFSYEHPDGATHVYSLTPDNQQLLTALHLLAKEETDPERLFPLRTVEENTVQYNAAEVITFTKALMEYIVQVLAKLWTIRDQAVAATTLAELPDVPEYITV
jgi:hypothetical protein